VDGRKHTSHISHVSPDERLGRRRQLAVICPDFRSTLSRSGDHACLDSARRENPCCAPEFLRYAIPTFANANRRRGFPAHLCSSNVFWAPCTICCTDRFTSVSIVTLICEKFAVYDARHY
jgi:hypothetical protein